MDKGPILEVLLVEDNADDAKLTIEAFRDAKTPATVHTVENGEDALRFLRREPPYLQEGPLVWCFSTLTCRGFQATTC